MRTLGKSLTGRMVALRARLRQHGKNEDGIAAVEFAFLGLPFIVLMFAILELAVIFFVNSALDHGASQAARLVRTGQMQEARESEAAQLQLFREVICDNMAGLQDCENRLRVDLVSGTRFSTTSLPPADYDTFAEKERDPITGEFPEESDPPPSVFDCSGPRQVVLLRAEFYHQLTLPRRFTFLGNDPEGHNRRILSTTTAFRNEPFPGDSGCTST